MSIDFLCYLHGNKHTKTHDAINDTLIVIAQDAGFHVGRKQLHALPSTMFNSFCWSIDIVFTNDRIRILVDFVIVNPTQTDLLL
jgi:hypothetical protein